MAKIARVDIRKSNVEFQPLRRGGIEPEGADETS